MPKKSEIIRKQLSFQSKLERIAEEANYFAFPVPSRVTVALGTKGPVPVYARVNGSDSFVVSLHPVGGGRHYLRVKAEIREQAKIKEGDKARIKITVRNRNVAVPKDLATALKVEGVSKDFKNLPPGKKEFMIRRIEEASKPETRNKRIQEAVELVHEKRETVKRK